jgi:hypothetical protein
MLQQNSRHTKDHKRKIRNLRNLRNRLRRRPQYLRSHSRSIRLKHYHHFRRRHTDRQVMHQVLRNTTYTNNKGRDAAASVVEEATMIADGVSPKTGQSPSTQFRIARHGF